MTKLIVEKLAQVTVIKINRPEVRNAIDRPTARELAKAFRDFEADDNQLAAVLTGTGGTFCAGADLKGISEGRGNLIREEGDAPLGCTRMLLSKPVIAAIEGHAVAGGLELALWSDLRVAARDAIFGVYCRRWGVPLVDGGSIRLCRLIGHSHALDLILTGRGVSGEEAKTMGLANRLVDPGLALNKAIQLAESLTVFPQSCMRADRTSSYEQWGMSMTDALKNEYRHGWNVIKSGETLAGALSFAEGKGRHGDFSDI